MSTRAENFEFKRGISSYSSIGEGDSSGSSSSSDNEEDPQTRRHELTYLRKRIFKDSTADLQGLETDYNKTNYYDMDPEEMDITNPGSEQTIKLLS